MNSNQLLNGMIILSLFLVISICFLYPPPLKRVGKEALEYPAAAVLLIITAVLLRVVQKRGVSRLQKRTLTLGLLFGLLWTIEIGINNLVRPGLPLRDIIDNIFWAVIALLIFITATREAILTNRFRDGVRAGLWSGIASGAVACLTALVLIVFGMGFILQDDLNIREWRQVNPTGNLRGMAAYFALETLAGAIMHLYILGILMGLILGIIGSVSAKMLNALKTIFRRRYRTRI